MMVEQSSRHLLTATMILIIVEYIFVLVSDALITFSPTPGNAPLASNWIALYISTLLRCCILLCLGILAFKDPGGVAHTFTVQHPHMNTSRPASFPLASDDAGEDLRREPYEVDGRHTLRMPTSHTAVAEAPGTMDRVVELEGSRGARGQWHNGNNTGRQ